VAVIDQQGNIVAHVDSNEAGVFRLDLMPGSYTLHLESTGSFGRAKDAQVSVIAGQATKVVITYDAGIRWRLVAKQERDAFESSIPL
jgi:hypothetical protein